MKIILAMFLLAGVVAAQDQRIELTTNSNKVVDLSTTTYDFGSYKNNTFKLGYNSDAAGNKIVPGEVDFALRFEPKWSMVEGFNTEVYLEWRNAAGTTQKRPWGMNILDADGSIHGTMHGRWSFFDTTGNQTASWLPEGYLDFYTAQGGVRFRNNTNAVSAYNAALTGILNIAKVDSQDRVVISATGAPILFGGPASGPTFYYTNTVRQGTPAASTQILGAQCAAIANSTGEKTDDRRAINEILACLRQHGLVSQ